MSYEFYPYLKAFHIVGVVSWFAGLFYILRLFIYHVEAESKPNQEKKILQDQLKIMERRLWKAITVPAMWFTLGTGLFLVLYHDLKESNWLHYKFTFLIGLFIYHFFCGRVLNKLIQDDLYVDGELRWSSKKLRMINEIPTFLLVIIVLLAVSKSLEMTAYGLGGFVGFFGILVLFFLKKLQGKK